MKYTWQTISEPFTVGMHTREICRLIDKAFDDFRRGKTTFLVIKVPFRHGKSQILSRYLPPHFLGEFPDNEVMMVTYNQSLAEDFSRYSRNILRSEQYAELYPNIKINNSNAGVQKWGIQNHLGGVCASGISSGLTGRGYALGVLDDYCASRADAESEVIRNSTWEHFTNDFLTRRAPVSITIVLATPWHVDDIIGRIEQKIDPKSEHYDPEFPQFKVISFPAMNGEVEVGVKDREKYGDNKYHLETKKYEYLFPERFSPDWYRQQFATLGDYASSALLQCNPTSRGGNLINTSKIKLHNDLSEFPNTKYYRIWDLAHTAKQTHKADPDWTSGTLLAYVKKDNVWELWVKNVARIQANAPERDNFIRMVAEKDGGNVTIAVENSVESKDALNQMQFILQGRRVVRPIQCKGDKIARIGYVEPIFDAGNVHVYNGDWTLDWLKEVKEFPSGKHDDQVDNLSAGYELICNGERKIFMGNLAGI